MKSKISDLSNSLVENGPKIAKEALNTIIRKKFSNIQNDTIDSTQDALVHYYTGEGRTVKLGEDTVKKIKNSKDMRKYRKNIQEGLTSKPAACEGKIPVDMELESTTTFHLGEMTMSYKTVCNDIECTTTYIVDDKGFVDPNELSSRLGEMVPDVVGSFLGIKDDNEGPNNELGGTPYDYEPVIWSETFLNPGYKVKNGKPLPLKK